MSQPTILDLSATPGTPPKLAPASTVLTGRTVHRVLKRARGDGRHDLLLVQCEDGFEARIGFLDDGELVAGVPYLEDVIRYTTGERARPPAQQFGAGRSHVFVSVGEAPTPIGDHLVGHVVDTVHSIPCGDGTGILHIQREDDTAVLMSWCNDCGKRIGSPAFVDVRRWR